MPVCVDERDAPTHPCTPDYTRSVKCHNQLAIELPSPDCCECQFGTRFDGENCVAPPKCPCVDEEGNDRAANEEWTDAFDPCIRHICVNNAVTTYR